MDIIASLLGDGTWGQLGSTFSLQDIFGGVASTRWSLVLGAASLEATLNNTSQVTPVNNYDFYLRFKVYVSLG